MKIGYFLPGYGEQSNAMAKSLYDDSRVVQEYFEEASYCLDINFVKLCFASSEHELGKIEKAYPSIFLVSSAIIGMLKSLSIDCSIVTGYGIGEYASLYAAGSLSLPDGLYFLSKLALLFSKELDQKSLASCSIAGLMDKSLMKKYEELINAHPDLHYSAIHSPHSSLVTGTAQEIDILKAGFALDKKKTNLYKIKEAPLEFGLYSKFSNKFISGLSMYLEKIDIKDCHTDWVNQTTGQIVQEGKKIKKSLLTNLTQTIRLDKVKKKFNDVDLILIPAPGIKLQKIVQELFPSKMVMNIASMKDIEKVIALQQNYKPLESIHAQSSMG